MDENGREGPPSLPSGEIVVKPGETVDITVGSGRGAADLNITHYRIYTSTQIGVYQLCTQIINAETVATDTPAGVTSVVNETPPGGGILKTIGWVAPPNNLQGMVVLRGGVAAGFSGKELMFSEPYHLHAWPAAQSACQCRGQRDADTGAGQWRGAAGQPAERRRAQCCRCLWGSAPAMGDTGL
ncbi:hypothetical protein [Endozoicomonas acroporae]|uniref:hypothetical protein n=1 Tax=Endozoicomonas acroporae TaxID=1701104 RepID=UPI003D7AE96B